MDQAASLIASVDSDVPAPLTAQDVTRSALDLAVAQAPAPKLEHPRNLLFTASDPEETVRAWALDAMGGRALAGNPVWCRLFTVDQTRGLVAVLHAFNSPAEMELVIFGHRGLLSRTMLRFLSSWAFNHVSAVGLRRIVMRLPVSATDAHNLAQRAGFHFEGTALGFFADGGDASVWAMTPGTCPWLLRPGAPASTVQLSPLLPSSSDRVH